MGVGIVFFALHRSIHQLLLKLSLLISLFIASNLSTNWNAMRKNVDNNLFWNFRKLLLSREGLQHLIRWTSPFYFSILFHMITSYMNARFTKLSFAYGYMLPSLLQSRHFDSFKELICRFLSPFSTSSHMYL